MQHTLTEQLLLLLADYLDRHRRFTSRSLINALSGDPRLGKHRRLMDHYLQDRRRRQQFYQAVYALKQRGYLQEQVLGSSEGYVLSPLGERKLHFIRLGARTERPKLPAGQWLMVFFDVPEEQRKTRDLLRSGLRRLGFEPLQRSVWATRYRVGRELHELVSLLRARRYAKPLLVRELPGNDNHRKS